MSTVTEKHKCRLGSEAAYLCNIIVGSVKSREALGKIGYP